MEVGRGGLRNLFAPLRTTLEKEDISLPFQSLIFTSLENVFTSSPCCHLSLLKSISHSTAVGASLPKQKIGGNAPIFNISPSFRMSSYKDPIAFPHSYFGPSKPSLR